MKWENVNVYNDQHVCYLWTEGKRFPKFCEPIPNGDPHQIHIKGVIFLKSQKFLGSNQTFTIFTKIFLFPQSVREFMLPYSIPFGYLF